MFRIFPFKKRKKMSFLDIKKNKILDSRLFLVFKNCVVLCFSVKLFFKKKLNKKILVSFFFNEKSE